MNIIETIFIISFCFFAHTDNLSYALVLQKEWSVKYVQINSNNVNGHNVTIQEIVIIILCYHYIFWYHIIFVLPINYFRGLYELFIQFWNDHVKHNGKYSIVDLIDTMLWCLQQNTKRYDQEYLVPLFYLSWIHLSIISSDTHHLSIIFWNSQGRQSGKCICFDSTGTIFQSIHHYDLNQHNRIY